MSAPASLLNEQFLDKFATEEGKIKIAGLGADYIKDRIREEGFIGQILTRKTVTRQDLQVSVNHEGMVKIVQTEMQTNALTASFRGQPDVNYISAPRYEVPFFRVESPRYEKTEIELMSYDIPLTDMVMKQIANDVQEVEDRFGLLLFESAVQAQQRKANGLALTATFTKTKCFNAANVAAGAVVEAGKCKGVDVLQNSAAVADTDEATYENLIYPLQKDDITKIKKLFIGNGTVGNLGRQRVDKILMSDSDFEDINNWTLFDVGDKIVQETTVEGYKFKTLQGVRYFRSLKTDILRPGNVWAFAPEEYLGGFMQLNKLQFFTDKQRDKFSFEAWEDIAMHIGNVTSLKKLELYAGTVDTISAPHANLAAYTAKYVPVAESDLGRLNNLVGQGQGGVFPWVSNF
jgi:hypothetical protein